MGPSYRHSGESRNLLYRLRAPRSPVASGNFPSRTGVRPRMYRKLAGRPAGRGAGGRRLRRRRCPEQEANQQQAPARTPRPCRGRSGGRRGPAESASRPRRGPVRRRPRRPAAAHPARRPGAPHRARGGRQRRYPTPVGRWHFQRVDINPDWTPPDSEWAEKEEAKQPGEEDNPMGRARLVFTGTTASTAPTRPRRSAPTSRTVRFASPTRTDCCSRQAAHRTAMTGSTA